MTARISIHGCATEAEVNAAFAAVRGYIEHPEYPQHQHIGKRTGGGATVDGFSFWVWKTVSGWNAELLEE